MWRGPLAYGQATADSTLLMSRSLVTVAIRLRAAVRRRNAVPVSALVDDLDTVVALACHRLAAATDRDWGVPASGLEWSCRGTVEHLADDLLSYAAQVAVRRPELDDFVPFLYWADPALPGTTDETAV